MMNKTILFCGLFYGFIETRYFGWNRTAGSDAEIICDGIAILIISLAWLIPKEKKDA